MEILSIPESIVKPRGHGGSLTFRVAYQTSHTDIELFAVVKNADNPGAKYVRSRYLTATGGAVTGLASVLNASVSKLHMSTNIVVCVHRTVQAVERRMLNMCFLQ